MAFVRTDFSPVGGQGRAGVVQQVFAYVSTVDSLATIKASGYFPIDSTDPSLNMLGVLSSGDWIMVSSSSSNFGIIFIDNDGRDGNPITTISTDITAA